MSFVEDEGEGITPDVFLHSILEENIPSSPSSSIFYASDEHNQPIVSSQIFHLSHNFFVTFVR